MNSTDNKNDGMDLDTLSLEAIEKQLADFEKEEREFRRAIELAPRSGAAYSWLGLLLAFQERTGEALELTRRATQLEPLSPNVQTNVAWCFFADRDFAGAEREVRRALALDPDALYPLWMSGLTFQMLGNHAESVAALIRSLPLSKTEHPHDARSLYPDVRRARGHRGARRGGAPGRGR